jgi:osmotically-inducible protein OsmY
MRVSTKVCCLLVSSFVAGGCRTPQTKPTASPIAAERSSGDVTQGTKTASPHTNATPVNATGQKGKAPVTVAGRSTAKPTPTLRPTQVQGTAVIRALNAEKAMQGHAISVGIMPGSGDVSLDGKVKSATQRTLAAKITRRVLPKAKITNRLQVQGALTR